MDSPKQEMDELEKKHVEEAYNEIAHHFSNISHTAWPKVKQFLKSLDTGAFVADIGCGNGRYLRINKRVWKLGSDRCEGLARIAGNRGHEVMVADNLHLPYRDNLFDALISVAVIHHFSTVERRIQALKELCRIVRPGGRLLICVWAFEQKHRRFDGQDVLVPWTMPKQRRSYRLSQGSSSDVSSNSSISEEEAIHDSIVTEQASVHKPGLPQTSFEGEDCVPVNTHSKSRSQNDKGISTPSDHTSHEHNHKKKVTGLLNKEARKSVEPTPPIRPSTLRLLHRNTRHVPSPQNKYKQHSGKLQQYQPQATEHNITLHPGQFSNHRLRKSFKNAQHLMAEEKISMKPLVENRKMQAVPILSVPNIGSHDTIQANYMYDTTKQSIQDTTIQPIEDSSILFKLKSMFTPKTKVSNNVKKTKDKLSWLHYYRNCVKDLEEDLTSFKTFCKLINSENNYENLSKEFIVRQFPESSQSCDKEPTDLGRSEVGHSSASSQTGQLMENGDSQHSQPVMSVNQQLENRVQLANGYPPWPSQHPQLRANQCGKCLQLSTEPFLSSTLQRPPPAQLSPKDISPGAKCTKHCANHQLPCNQQHQVCARSTDTVVQDLELSDQDHGGHWKRGQHKSQNRTSKEKVRTTDLNSQNTKKETASSELNGDDVFEDFTSSMSACLTNLSNLDTTSATPNMSLQRFYHVFKEGELEALICTHVPELTIIHSYFDHANWCLIAEKRCHSQN